MEELLQTTVRCILQDEVRRTLWKGREKKGREGEGEEGEGREGKMIRGNTDKETVVKIL